MNFNQLSYLVEAARLGSFSMAATQLYVTPQTVSKALGEFEDELGITLFVRNGRRLVVTDEARLIAEKAENVLACVSDMEGLAAQLRSRSDAVPERIALAVASSPLRGVLVPECLLTPFSEQYPRVELVVRRNGSESCLTAVQQGLVDAAVTLGRTTREGLRWTQICPAVFDVTMSKNHPLAAHDAVSIAEVACFPVATPMDFRCAYRIIEHQFEARSAELPYTDVDPTPEAHREFLSMNGVMFTAREPKLDALYPDAVTKPLVKADSISIPLCLVFREDNDNPAISLLQFELLRVACRLSHASRPLNN